MGRTCTRSRVRLRSPAFSGRFRAQTRIRLAAPPPPATTTAAAAAGGGSVCLPSVPSALPAQAADAERPVLPALVRLAAEIIAPPAAHPAASWNSDSNSGDTENASDTCSNRGISYGSSPSPSPSPSESGTT